MATTDRKELTLLMENILRSSLKERTQKEPKTKEATNGQTIIHIDNSGPMFLLLYYLLKTEDREPSFSEVESEVVRQQLEQMRGKQQLFYNELLSLLERR